MTDFKQNDKFRDSYNIYTISLNTDVGNHRKSLLNFDTEIFEACTYESSPQFIKDKFKFFKIGKKTARPISGQHGTIGCFSSHYLVIKKIADEQIDNAIITEDDAMQKANLPDPSIFTEPTLLGAFLHHPTSFRDTERWAKEVMPEIIFSWSTNVIEIDYSIFRWRGCHSYLFPKWQQAKKIVEHIENASFLKAIDTELPNNKLLNHLHYPAIFEQRRDLKSQIETNLYAGERKSMI
tara:strand:+ start:4992 stop:5702 length:711 start_codon:yes stop_codon:yes gene_type:complete